jgi:hypothetical protein
MGHRSCNRCLCSFDRFDPHVVYIACYLWRAAHALIVPSVTQTPQQSRHGLIDDFHGLINAICFQIRIWDDRSCCQSIRGLINISCWRYGDFGDHHGVCHPCSLAVRVHVIVFRKVCVAMSAASTRKQGTTLRPSSEISGAYCGDNGLSLVQICRVRVGVAGLLDYLHVIIQN